MLKVIYEQLMRGSIKNIKKEENKNGRDNG